MVALFLWMRFYWELAQTHETAFMTENNLENLLGTQNDESFVDPELILQQVLENRDLVQHVTRTQESGVETIVGYFRIEFEPGQQRSVLHVPFAPPLKIVPKVDAHVTDHDNVRVRVTDCQKFGVRTEVILDQALQSHQKILVEISATEAE